MTLVKSSHIRSVKRDKKTNDLQIRFKNGSTYAYEDVSKNEEQEMLSSPSVGKAFWLLIRDEKPTKKI